MELVNKVLTHWYSYFPPTWPDSDTRNMLSDFAVNKYLRTVASGWIFINILSILDIF